MINGSSNENLISKMRLSLVLLSILTLFSSALYSQNLYGENPDECKQRLTIMTTYYKQKAYKDAKPSFQYLLSSCPQASKNIYIIGSVILEEELEQATDENQKNRLVDSLLLLQDLRVKYFSTEEANAYRAKKAIYLIKHRSSEAELAFKMLDSCFSTQPSDLSLYELQIFMKINNYLVRAKRRSCEELTADYFAVMSYLNGEQEDISIEKLKGQINDYADPCLNCETLDSIAKAAFATNSDDTLWLDQQIELLKAKSCKNSKTLLLLIEKRFETKADLKNAQLLSAIYSSNKEYVKAQQYLDQALQTNSQPAAQASLLLEKAKIYQYQGNFIAAYQAANKSNTQQPSSKAYLLAGDAIISATSSCSSLTFGGKELFWLACDYYNQARSIAETSDEKEEISAKINRYSQYFPEQSELFLKSISEGSSYKISCVFNADTKVRAKKQ